jgi:osmotically-inducible protein OsmY
VTGVHNNLMVVLPERDYRDDIKLATAANNALAASYALDPVEVDRHVQQALDRAALVPDDSDVTANTKDGIITLTGHVRTWAEHDAVIGAALMARGVTDIRDELQVTG